MRMGMHVHDLFVDQLSNKKKDKNYSKTGTIRKERMHGTTYSYDSDTYRYSILQHMYVATSTAATSAAAVRLGVAAALLRWPWRAARDRSIHSSGMRPDSSGSRTIHQEVEGVVML